MKKTDCVTHFFYIGYTLNTVNNTNNNNNNKVICRYNIQSQYTNSELNVLKK